MKSSLLAACLIAFLPAMALGQALIAPEAPPKPKPFEPVLPENHTGTGLIGVRLVFDKATGLPQIASIIRGSPAEDFGLRVGDVLIRINKNDTTALTEDEVHLSLRGEPGIGVELTIQRDDNPKYLVVAVERRVLLDSQEDILQPPCSEVAKAPLYLSVNLPAPGTTTP